METDGHIASDPPTLVPNVVPMLKQWWMPMSKFLILPSLGLCWIIIGSQWSYCHWWTNAGYVKLYNGCPTMDQYWTLMVILPMVHQHWLPMLAQCWINGGCQCHNSYFCHHWANVVSAFAASGHIANGMPMLDMSSETNYILVDLTLDQYWKPMVKLPMVHQHWLPMLAQHWTNGGCQCQNSCFCHHWPNVGLALAANGHIANGVTMPDYVRSKK